MGKNKERLLSLVMTVTLSCVSTSRETRDLTPHPPTKQELEEADYGIVLQDVVQSSALQWLQEHLKDPMSAEVRYAAALPGWFMQAPIFGGTVYYGHVLTITVNAKNAFGGYTGWIPYQFFFQDNKLCNVSVYRYDGHSFSFVTEWTSLPRNGKPARKNTNAAN